MLKAEGKAFPTKALTTSALSIPTSAYPRRYGGLVLSLTGFTPGEVVLTPVSHGAEAVRGRILGSSGNGPGPGKVLGPNAPG
jgi:hypothetical protein